ncbi:hypothetical protein [Lactobacillus phage Sabazios]|nr:hypothetical protein [Lactobacillus phage Silenus]AYH91874.1 hypothetical protein [Lactobacillus phage Sabazios]
MKKMDKTNKKMKFEIVGCDGKTVIKEFSSQYEADLYRERLNYERLERLSLIERLDMPAIKFE